MQAVPLATLNGSVMAAFKPPSLSPPSTKLAQTMGKMGSSNVYEISATTTSTTSSPPVHSPTSDLEDKCRLGEEAMSYATQYYSTVESQSRASSPTSTGMLPSPKDSCAGNLTPVSISSKETSSSSDSMSALEEDAAMLGHQGMCIPISSEENTGEQATTQVRHWTYEDQFKQLYNLSQSAERKEFLDKLFNFMQSKGTPITRVPIMAKQPLDLYKLFKLVVERGGLVEVIKKKAWRNVAKELNLPASITSAAFTMRSQYVKYLYPYECETVKLSDPQELQLAIDSNKRDRRHSENMDFIAPQLQRAGEMDPILSPVVSTTTPQGLQLISSPTMALPHTSLPHYSGGFIVTGGPGGTHQLVQMTPHVPGIPIVMPSPNAIPVSAPHSQQAAPLSSHSHASSEDREDVQSHSSGESLAPPAKRQALEPTHIKIGGGGASRGGYSIHQTSNGNIIMTHGGVAPANGPQLIQMGPHGQIPIVLPTSTVRPEQKCPTPQYTHINGSKTENSVAKSESPGGGNTVTALPHSHPSMMPQQQQQQPRPSVPPPHAARSLLQMTHHPSIPGLVIPHQLTPTPPAPHNGEERRKAEDKNVATAHPNPPPSNPTAVKMPFANISIQPAGGKTEGEEQNGLDASLLVTLEINSTVYQGVLFAKPNPVASPQR